MYLPKRTFTDKGTMLDPVCGVAQVDPEYLKVTTKERLTQRERERE